MGQLDEAAAHSRVGLQAAAARPDVDTFAEGLRGLAQTDAAAHPRYGLLLAAAAEALGTGGRRSLRLLPDSLEWLQRTRACVGPAISHSTWLAGGRLRLGQTLERALKGPLAVWPRGAEVLSKRAAAAGADAVVCRVPFGGGPSTDGIRQHFEGYAFPHSGGDESRRLRLFEERLDPLTIRRVERLGLAPGARCLEVGGGHGSIARWLCHHVGPRGRVTATDLETGFLSERSLPNLEVLRHDVRTDEFPERAFDLVHARADIMHIGQRAATLRRMVSWLAPGGWLLVEDADFGMWMGDADPIWAAHPRAVSEAFPNMSQSQGRAILKQIHRGCQQPVPDEGGGVGRDAGAAGRADVPADDPPTPGTATRYPLRCGNTRSGYLNLLDERAHGNYDHGDPLNDPEFDAEVACTAYHGSVVIQNNDNIRQWQGARQSGSPRGSEAVPRG